MQRRIRLFAILTGAILGTTIVAAQILPVPLPEFPRLISEPMTPVQQQILLDAHNRTRADAGVPPLVWSSTLADIAQHWADHLATSLHHLEHSHAPGLGENLAMWTAGKKSPEQLYDLFVLEKADFSYGTFPNVSRTGDWHAVGHYTQIMWRGTTKVGCGLATSAGDDYLVCEYVPRGNIPGREVY